MIEAGKNGGLEEYKKRYLQNLRELRGCPEEPRQEIWLPGDVGYSTTKYRMSVFTAARNDLNFMIRHNLITDPIVIKEANVFIHEYWKALIQHATKGNKRILPDDIEKLNQILDFVLG